MRVGIATTPIIRVLYAVPGIRWGISKSMAIAKRMFIPIHIRFENLIEIAIGEIKAYPASTRLSEGYYTSRAIRIVDPIEPKDLGLSCRGVGECKKELYEWAGKISTTLSNILRDLQGQAKNIDIGGIANELFGNVSKSLRETLIHEVLHSLEVMGTSTSWQLEAIAWRTRLDNMYVLEEMYRAIGRDMVKALSKKIPGLENHLHRDFRVIPDVFKGVSRDDAREILEGIGDKIRRLSHDKNFREAVIDAYQSHIYLRSFIAWILIPLIEPTTWYILGHNINEINEILDKYYENGVFSDLHRGLANHVIEVIESNKPESGALLKATRDTLDMPLKDWEVLWNAIAEAYRSGENIVDEIANIVVYKRFDKALKGEGIEVMPPSEKSFLSMLLYAIPVERVPDISRFLVDLLSEEPSIKDFLFKKIREGVSIEPKHYLSLFVDLRIGGEIHPMVYDPLSMVQRSETILGRMVRRTGLSFGTFEDLVGDLPLALRGFATFITCLSMEGVDGGIEILAKRIGLDENRLRDLWNELNNMGLGSVVEDLERGSGSCVETYINAFLYTVLRLGADVKRFGGLHGLSYI